MPPRFFSSTLLQHDDLPATVLADQHIATHLRALRMRVDDAVVLFDGSGAEWRARLTRLEKREIVLQLEERIAVSRESRLNITLVQSLVSAEKMDWIVQKATELGVAAIVPLRAARSTLRLDVERAAKKLDHWRGVAIAACEQCGRNQLPLILPLTDLATWCAQPATKVAYALHPLGQQSLAECGADGTPLAIVIGPEGGFDAHEVELLARACTLVTLGPRVLRTETAGIAALATLQAICGDYSLTR